MRFLLKNPLVSFTVHIMYILYSSAVIEKVPFYCDKNGGKKIKNKGFLPFLFECSRESKQKNLALCDLGIAISQPDAGP